jgi:hypothetical protein
VLGSSLFLHVHTVECVRDLLLRLGLGGVVAPGAGIPQGRLRAQVVQPGVMGGDLGFNALGVTPRARMQASAWSTSRSSAW